MSSNKPSWSREDRNFESEGVAAGVVTLLEGVSGLALNFGELVLKTWFV
jgi:hypothetical protein